MIKFRHLREKGKTVEVPEGDATRLRILDADRNWERVGAPAAANGGGSVNVAALVADRDSWKTRAEVAEAELAKFTGGETTAESPVANGLGIIEIEAEFTDEAKAAAEGADVVKANPGVAPNPDTTEPELPAKPAKPATRPKAAKKA